MANVKEQSTFLYNVSRLVIWAYESNLYMITGGELQRPEAMQLLYLYGYDIIDLMDRPVLISINSDGSRIKPKTKTKTSDHFTKTAIDLNIFIKQDDGSYRLATTEEDIKPIGEKWESMDDRNIWGALTKKAETEKGIKEWDSNHFSMRCEK